MMAPKIAQNKQQNNKIKNLEGTTDEIILDGDFCIDQLGGGVVDFDGFDIDWFLGFLDQEDTEKMNEENLSVIDSVDDSLDVTTEEYLGGDFCIDQLTGGVLDFDGFDIDWFLGCLNSDEKNNKKMNLDGTEGNLRVIDNGVGVDDNLDETGNLTAGSLVGGFCFDDLCGGDLNSDIDCLMRYLDSDQQEESVEESAIDKLARREFGIGDQELDEFGGGSCLDDLGLFDIDWFMRYLDSDQQEDPVENSTTDKLENRKYEAEFGGGFCDDLGVFDIDWFMRCLDSEEPIESSTANKLDKRKYEAEFVGGGFYCDDLGGGDLCSDDLGNFDVDWLMQCLNSNLEEELVENSTTSKPEKGEHEDESGGGLCFDNLGDFDVDRFMLLLDSNQEEDPVGHSTISKLQKRNFQGEEDSCQTKKMRL